MCIVELILELNCHLHLTWTQLWSLLSQFHMRN